MEQSGEVDLIGSWAEIAPDPELAGFVGTGVYVVFVSSDEPVLLYVQIRTTLGFEIHAVPVLQAGRTFSIRCCCLVMAPRADAGAVTRAASRGWSVAEGAGSGR